MSSRDARVLMGTSGDEAKEKRVHLDSFFSNEAMAAKHAANQPPKKAPTPPRLSREVLRSNSVRTMVSLLLFINCNARFLYLWRNIDIDRL